MIERNRYQLNYIKKENQSGSHKGMRFTFSKSEDALLVTVYPEPYCLQAAPEEKKTSKTFDLTKEGLDAAVDWLNEYYQEKRNDWLDAYEKRMML